MALEHGDRVGSYEVIAQVGAGGMGEVYRARDLSLDRDGPPCPCRVRANGPQQHTRGSVSGPTDLVPPRTVLTDR